MNTDFEAWKKGKELSLEEIGTACEAWNDSRAEADTKIAALRDALRDLMVAITPELTGPPKNIPKSSWAEQWDTAERLLIDSGENTAK